MEKREIVGGRLTSEELFHLYFFWTWIRHSPSVSWHVAFLEGASMSQGFNHCGSLADGDWSLGEAWGTSRYVLASHDIV